MISQRMIRSAAALVTAVMFISLMPGCVHAQPTSTFVEETMREGTEYGCRKSKPDNSKYSISYPSSKYKTLQDAVDDAKEGTIITIKGRIEEQVRIEKNGITLKGDGTGVIAGNSKMNKGGELIAVTGKNVVIEDLEVTEFYIYKPSTEYCADAIWIGDGAENVHVLNCKVHHVGCQYGEYKYSEDREYFNGHGISVKGEKNSKVSDIVISGCEVYDLTTGQSECVVLNDNVEYFTVSGNYIHDNDNIGIDLAGGYNGQHATDRVRYGEVCGNKVENISSLLFENPGYIDDDGEPGSGSDGIYVDGGSDIWIHDNFVMGCDIGLEIASENKGWTAEGVIAENNILVYNDQCGGITLGGESSSYNGKAVNNIIRNNTVINSGESCCVVVSYSEGNVVENNILICDTDPVEGEFISYNTIDNNASNRASDVPGDNASIKIDTKKGITVDKKNGTVKLDTSSDITGYGSSNYGKGPTTAPTAAPMGKVTSAPTAKPTKVPGGRPTAVPTSVSGSTTTPTPFSISMTDDDPDEPTPVATKKPSPTSVPVAPEDQIRAFVDRIYVYVLDREPEAEGAEFWTTELYSFRRTGAEAAQGFIFSPEFEGRKTSDTEFVTILYKTFFGREPEEGGMEYWLSQLSSGSMDRVAVANGFIFSQEWADTCASYGIRSGGDIKSSLTIKPTALTYAFVERIYTTAMKRDYDKEGREYWAGELSNFNVTGEQVGASFFLSDEMTGYGLSDAEFLNRLYATFMDRESDSDGASYWLGVMASGTPRSDVVFGFTRSPEFTEKCIEARILPY